MSSFGQWAKNYYDNGLSVLPIHPEKKACFIKGWTEKFSKRFPTEEEQDYYIEHYADHDLGLACGGTAGIVGIDFDYINPSDADFIESLIIGALPVTPVIKKGSKGWTRFYRSNGDIVNKSIDRGNVVGGRMIDVLATGRITVLPPSQHKEGMRYQWTGSLELLDADCDDMPVITLQHIRQLEEISKYDNKFFGEQLIKKARHDAIVGFILRYSDQAKDMDQLVQAMIQADIDLHKDDPKGPYLADQRYLKGKTSYQYARELADRVCEWKVRKRKDQGLHWEIGKYPRLHSEGKKQSTNYDDFKSFFEFNYPSVRFDRIRKTSYHYSHRLRRWEPIDNIREVIESQAAEVGLSPSYVNRHLQRWLSTLDPRLCIDIKRWQGKDVLSEMMGRLEIKNIEHELAVELFKEWGANIFRRLYDRKKREQNAMIILKGDQGIGKDSWINYMFAGLENYFSEIEIQDRKIENFQTISDLLVANIPEFDETHKVSLATLKSLLTSPGATFRAAYARKAEFVPFYVSYISSCNFDNILRDSSGNRRFMIFEVESIKWGYDDVPQDQIIAQFHHLYQTNYKASAKARQAMKDYIAQETPDEIDDLIYEDCKHVIQGSITLLRPWAIWAEISRDIQRIAKTYGVGIRRVQTLMRRRGLRSQDRDGKFYAIDAHPSLRKHDAPQKADPVTVNRGQSASH